MAKKTVGYIELQWTCPKCGTLNPGPVKSCNGCGAPQPVDVKFEQAARQELIADEGANQKAKAGADIHCPYCGTRNPAGTKVCVQCNGDLTTGVKRETGRVVGAFKTGPAIQAPCPHCGTMNPDTAKVCASCGGSMAVEKELPLPASPQPTTKPNRLMLIAIAGVLVLLCGAIALFAILSQRTEAVTGVVQGVHWERSIPIEALAPVTYQDWQDQIPQGAEIGTCQQEVRSVLDEPATNSVEVCGTPYSVDTGSGYAEVVQDCEYQVYDSFCSYSSEEWKQVDTMSLSGNDFSPIWPEPALQEGQRLGEAGTETYQVIFDTGDRTYTFATSDFNLYQQAKIGSEWKLNITSLGNVVSIER